MNRSAPQSARIGVMAMVALSAVSFFGVSMIGPGASPAMAQSAVCEKLKDYLADRQALVGRINKLGKRPDAKAACSLFGNLASNGSATLKWLETNKEWCQIPDQFISGFKADNARAVQIRGQACKAATQQASMEKRAREQQQNQSPMLGGSGGDPVTGQMKIPQGAL